MSRRRVPLAVAAVLGAAAALTGCAGVTRPVSGYVAAATAPPSAAPAAATPAPTPAGPVAHAEGLTFALPAGWTDTTDDLTSAGAFLGPVELVVRGPKLGGESPVVDVVSVSGVDSKDINDATAREVRAIVMTEFPNAVAVGGIDHLTVGGEPAVAYTIRARVAGIDATARQVLTSHFLELRAITLTATTAGYAQAQPAFQTMLGSWVWR